MKQNEIETYFANVLTDFGKIADPYNYKWPFTDEDMTFDTTDIANAGKPYMRGACVMGTPYNASISDGDHIFIRQEGFYQVTLHFPAVKESPSKLRQYAESVRRLFWNPGASTRTQGTTQIDIRKMPEINRIPPSGPYIRSVVTVYFQVEDVPGA